MGRPKKTVQPELAPRKAATPPPAPVLVPAPRMLEYTPAAFTENWRVERFDLLAVRFEFGLEKSAADWRQRMTEFHDFCATHSQPTAWLIVRRLFGVQPVVMPETAHEDDFRTHTREELSASMGLPLAQLEIELDFMKTGWAEFMKQVVETETATSKAREEKSQAIEKTDGELALDDKLLTRYGFHPTFFKAMVWDAFAPITDGEGKVISQGKEVERSESENKAEMEWFVAKLRSSEWQKMLDEPMTSELARETLLNEMTLRRLQREMAPLSQGSKKYQELNNVRTTVKDSYRGQMEELQKKFPEMGVAGKVSFRQVVSDLNLAHRQYYGKKDNRLWDKMFTAAEIQFLLRQSSQQPSARYRLGWTVACVEAMNGMYNPEFRSQLKKSDLAKLDMGFKIGVEMARKNLGEPLVNLERGVLPGEGDEFEEYGPDKKEGKSQKAEG